MTDWVEWHRGYDDPASSLSRRLVVVQARIEDALGALPPGRRKLLSLCAGDGRDVIGVLAEHPRGADIDSVLIELDPSLAIAAEAAGAAAGLSCVDVRQGDAGDCAGYRDALPVDVLLLCGIFGNVDGGDIRRTIGAVPSMVGPGGFAIWTRGSARSDLRPQIRAWFGDAGLREIAFDGEPEPFGVGLYQMPANELRSPPLPKRLFAFTA